MEQSGHQLQSLLQRSVPHSSLGSLPQQMVWIDSNSVIFLTFVKSGVVISYVCLPQTTLTTACDSGHKKRYTNTKRFGWKKKSFDVFPTDCVKFLLFFVFQTQNNWLIRDLSSTVEGTFTRAPPETRVQDPSLPFTFPQPSLSAFQPKHHISPHTSPFNGVLPCPLQSSPILLPNESRQPRKKSSTDPDMCAQLSSDQLSFQNALSNQRNKLHSSLHQHLPENKEGHRRLISRTSGKGGKSAMSQGEGTEAETGKKRKGTSSSKQKGSR